MGEEASRFDPLPTLAEQNREVLETYLRGLPEEGRRAVLDELEVRYQSDASRGAKVTGDPAPDFTLPDPDGRVVTLSERLAKGPVVLSFYRGGWCRFCALELRALQRRLPAIEVHGADVLAVSPESAREARRTRAANGVTFPLLSDEDNAVALSYGLVFGFRHAIKSAYREWGLDLPPAQDAFEVPVPATYVIDAGGRITASFVDQDYTKRMEPSDIASALRELAIRTTG